jgi:hypothetical protein
MGFASVATLCGEVCHAEVLYAGDDNWGTKVTSSIHTARKYRPSQAWLG